MSLLIAIWNAAYRYFWTTFLEHPYFLKCVILPPYSDALDPNITQGGHWAIRYVGFIKMFVLLENVGGNCQWVGLELKRWIWWGNCPLRVSIQSLGQCDCCQHQEAQFNRWTQPQRHRQCKSHKPCSRLCKDSEQTGPFGAGTVLCLICWLGI